MITMTLQEAKAKLNQLVEHAEAGESVVLLRGSKIVATIVPLSADDLEIAPRLTDRQAQKFWQSLTRDKRRSFTNADSAIGHLRRQNKP